MSNANILEKTFLSLIILVTIGAFLLPVYQSNKEKQRAIKDEQDWQIFSKTHSCKVVEKNRFTTGYLCDDGVLYRR